MYFNALKWGLGLVLVNLPVANYHHLQHLDDLFLEEVNCLKIALLADDIHSLQELCVVRLWQGYAGEQIGNDTLEEGYVVGQEFWQIHIHDGTKQL